MSPLSIRVFLALLWGASVLFSTELTAAAVPETNSSVNSTATHIDQTEKPTPSADQPHAPAEVDASTAAERSQPTTVETHNRDNSGESTTVLVAYTTAAAAETAGTPLHQVSTVVAVTAGGAPVSHHILETIKPTERGPQQQQQASTTLKAMTSSDAGTHVMIQPVAAPTSVPQPISDQEHPSPPPANSTSPPSEPMTSTVGMSDSVTEISSTSEHLLPAPTQTTAPATANANSTAPQSDNQGVKESSTSVMESSSTSKNLPPASTPAREEANSTSLPSDPMTTPIMVREMSTSVPEVSSTFKNPPPTSTPSSTPDIVKTNATSLPSNPMTTPIMVREMSTSVPKHLSPAPNHTSPSEVHLTKHLTSTPGSSTLSSSGASTKSTATASSFVPSTTSTSAAPCVVPSSSPSGGPYACSTRGMAQQCLIAVASLAAVATVFIVCTIVLCTKLSSRKYKVRSPPATEMMCLPSLLNERSYHYARHRNPISNGVLVIHGGDSDEEGGDNLTLSSFLPENERYV